MLGGDSVARLTVSIGLCAALITPATMENLDDISFRDPSLSHPGARMMGEPKRCIISQQAAEPGANLVCVENHL